MTTIHRFIAAVSIVLFFLTGCVSTQDTQLLGRISKDSPTQLISGKNKISFFSQGTRIAGHVFLPPDYCKDQKLPALIMVAPESGVKEQSPGKYALKMSQKGYLTLAFDHRSFDESGGKPRLLEDPFMKIEDIKNAVSYIRSLKMTDKDRIGLIGICAGAGYSTVAAAFDVRVKAIATASGIFDFTDFRPNVRNESADKYFSNLLQLAGEGRQTYFETGITSYTNGAFYGEEPEGKKTLNAYYKGSEAYEKYAKLFWKRASDFYHNPERGLVKTWEDRRLNPALDSRFALNASYLIHLVSPRPILFIKGSGSISGYATDIAFKKAQKPKEVLTLEGANHFDLYDNDAYLQPATEKLNTFFTKAFKH
ncbi:MAG: alpha/beta hydrolase [Desulfobacteraceae bacterium]|nr:alpha/beta hydrolase [Desulfobacteraceae bacterium]